MIGPGTSLILFILGGVGSVAYFTTWELAQQIGPKLTLADLRPSMPWEGLPLPRFVYTKPELLAELRRR